MKRLGVRPYRELDSVFDNIVALSDAEYSVLRRALAAHYWTTDWVGNYETHIRQLQVDTFTRNLLLDGTKRTHPQFQRSDGKLYAFEEWAAAIVANHDRHGENGDLYEPAITALQFGPKRYVRLVEALRLLRNKLRIVKGEPAP